MEIYKRMGDRIEVSALRVILMCLVASMVVATTIVLLEFIKAEPRFLTIAKEDPEIILAVWGLIVLLFAVISSIGSILYANVVADKVNFLRKKSQRCS